MAVVGALTFKRGLQEDNLGELSTDTFTGLGFVASAVSIAIVSQLFTPQEVNYNIDVVP